VGLHEVIVADTHAWLWWFADPSRLSGKATRALDEEDIVAISAISLCETAFLARRQRIDLIVDTFTFFERALEPEGTLLLPITPAIAIAASGLDQLRDPADRLIVATALEHHARLVTKDARIRDAKVVETIW